MSYRVEKDVMVPMRDGTALATDLWIPDNRPAPVLLARTPYGKDFPNLLANALDPRPCSEPDTPWCTRTVGARLARTARSHPWFTSRTTAPTR